MKSTLIAVIVIAVIAIAAAYFIGQSSNNLIYKQSLNDSTVQSTQTPNQQIASIENQKQCATDGKTFFQNWLQTDLQKDWKYNGPEYHFNQKLNTCLVYLDEVYIYPTYKYDSPMTSTHDTYIYDVYANKPILQSWTFRTCEFSTSSPCTETIQSPWLQDVPNVGSGDFYAQKKILMSE